MAIKLLGQAKNDDANQPLFSTKLGKFLGFMAIKLLGQAQNDDANQPLFNTTLGSFIGFRLNKPLHARFVHAVFAIFARTIKSLTPGFPLIVVLNNFT